MMEKEIDMTTIENEATSILSEHDAAKAVTRVDTSKKGVDKEQEEEDLKQGIEMTERFAENSKNDHRKAKIISGVTAGGAALSGVAAAFMNTGEASADYSDDIAEDIEEAENVSIAAEVVELPELVVEALAAKHDGQQSDSSSTDMRVEMNSSSSETIFAQTVATNPNKTDHSSYAQTKPEETISIQTASKPEEDLYGEDIPIVSVGNITDNESDIQILGVTQDISTGYNVGHLSVDGEEVVVIDVDGDMVFDSMVIDLNHDGETTPDEIIDIRQHSLTLDDISGHSDLFTDPLGGDAPDYLTDL